MTREKVKYILIALGTLDFVSFYRTYENGFNMFLVGSWGELSASGPSDVIFTIVVTLNSILILSLIISGLLCIFRPRTSFLIYYFQIPLRLIFFTLTFGFILRLPGLQIDSWTYKIVLALVVILELLRLIFSIWTQRKYYRVGQTASP
jgi:hypothetical protein